MIMLYILLIVITLGYGFLFLIFRKLDKPETRVFRLLGGSFTVTLWVMVIYSCLVRINPGEIGVIVNLLGDDRGVEQKEATIGIHFIAPWKTVYKFPTFEQNHQWTESDSFVFQTSEGLSVQSDIGISYHLNPEKIYLLFAKYRRGMDEITHLFIRNNLRDAINRHASKMKIEELIGPKKEEFFTNIHDSLKKELDDLGFVITHVYIIGQFTVPDNVKEALNAKIAATQKAQQRENELRETEAKAKMLVAESEGISKSILIKARAEADANNLISKSLNKDLLQWNSINKWDGKLPYAMSGNGTPFILNLPENK